MSDRQRGLHSAEVLPGLTGRCESNIALRCSANGDYLRYNGNAQDVLSLRVGSIFGRTV